MADAQRFVVKKSMSEEKSSTELSSYGKDTPIGRPDVDGRAGVFVPTDQFDIDNTTTIRKGAGIVGYGNLDGSLTVYFEANRFDESNLHKWEDKARKAYERMVAGAPTVSKAKIDSKMLEQIGIIDGMGINLKYPERLSHWLERSNVRDTAPEHAIVLWKTR
ncbi:hypothetical protein AAKU55_004679 [Oxalobacteraceae bacterium GrIS 1.11]